MVHKMLVEFEPEEYKLITELAEKTNGSRRGWVMNAVRQALKAAVAPPPPKAWMFKLKGGEIKRAAGEDMAQAWYSLGYTMADIELIDERLPEKEAIEAGWVVKKAPMVVAEEDYGLPFGQ